MDIKVLFSLCTLALAQEDYGNPFVNSRPARVEYQLPETSPGISLNEQVRDKQLRIASLMDGRQVRFAKKLKKISVQMKKEHKTWNKKDLLSRIKTGMVGVLNEMQTEIRQLLALSRDPQGTLAALAEHLDYEHLKATVTAAIQVEYPMGLIVATEPSWRVGLAKEASEFAIEYAAALINKLSAERGN